MQVRFTDRAYEDDADALPAVKKAFEKQLQYLLSNLQHSSLHAKKYDAANDVWQGRVNRSWRFYFTIDGEEYVILSIISHPQ